MPLSRSISPMATLTRLRCATRESRSLTAPVDGDCSSERQCMQLVRERIAVWNSPEPGRRTRQIGLGKADPVCHGLSRIHNQLTGPLQAGVQVEGC